MAISPQYQAYLNSPKWKAKRLKVLKKAKFKCQKCREKRATQVHHKTYKRIFNERLSDLQAVCGLCHKKIHKIDKKPKKRIFRGLKRVFARVI
jgi:5-methylcytosine-specific restriction endonuclease McrA